MLITEGDKEKQRGRTNSRKHAHGIAVGVQLKKLVLGPLGFPGQPVAWRSGRFLGMDIIVTEAMHGILAVSPL